MRLGRRLQPDRPGPAPYNTPMLSPQRGQTLHPTRRTPRPGGSLGSHSHPPPLLSSPEPARKKASYEGQTAINRYFGGSGGRVASEGNRTDRQEGGARGEPCGSAGAEAAGAKSPVPEPLPAPVLDAARRQRFSRSHPCRGCGWAEGFNPVVRAQPRATLLRFPRNGYRHCTPPTAPRVRAVPSAAIPPAPSPFDPGICPQKSLLRGTDRHKPLSPQLGGRAVPEGGTARIGRRAAPERTAQVGAGRGRL